MAPTQNGKSAERPSPERRAAYRVFEPLSARWRDNDVYGHVNNVVYYEYFDTAVNGHMIAGGALDIETSPVVALVVDSACAYFAPVAYPDRITAGLRAARIGTSSVVYEIGIFRNDDDLAAAQGRFTHVYVDRQTRRPVPIPDAARAILEPMRTDRDV